MKPVDVKSNTYINLGKEISNKDPKFNIGDNVAISKYRDIFAKGYVPNWSEQVFVKSNTNTKSTVPWTLVILTEKKLLDIFSRKNCKNTNQKEFRVEKVIKRKGDKLYVKW